MCLLHPRDSRNHVCLEVLIHKNTTTNSNISAISTYSCTYQINLLPEVMVEEKALVVVLLPQKRRKENSKK